MSIILADFTAFVVINAHVWLASLRGTILEKTREIDLYKGEEIVSTRVRRSIQPLYDHLEGKGQLLRLEQALRNAAEHGLVTCHTSQEHNLYKDILQTLSQPSPSGEVLRHEVMQLFIDVESPDRITLNETYNRCLCEYNVNHRDIDVAPYLNSFFSALIGELYADPYFRPQLSDVLQRRARHPHRRLDPGSAMGR